MTDGSSVTIDLTAPTLSSVSIASNSSVLSSLAKAGDVITVSIQATQEDIRAVVVLIGGHAADVTQVTVGDLRSYTARYTVVSTTADGEAAVVIDFEDMAGNAGAKQTSTTDASKVIVDTTAPTLAALTMVSSNAANSSLAIVGDTITVTITASEAIGTPSVTIAGQAASVQGSGTAVSYTHLTLPTTPYV